jgi:hypothetical protein
VASERIRKLAKMAYEELEKEFSREYLVGILVDGDFLNDWSESGLLPISEDEANQVVDLLEHSGRIIRDVIDIHKGEEEGFYWVTEYYPNTVAKIRAYKRSRQYREWLGWKKYGKTPSWMKGWFSAKPSREKQKEKVVPGICPVCSADLSKTTCDHFWTQMLFEMEWSK